MHRLLICTSAAHSLSSGAGSVSSYEPSCPSVSWMVGRSFVRIVFSWSDGWSVTHINPDDLPFLLRN